MVVKLLFFMRFTEKNYEIVLDFLFKTKGNIMEKLR